jgi:hypothetical protein
MSNLTAMPPASEVRRMDASEFENNIAAKAEISKLSVAPPRQMLDWEHVNDLNATHPILQSVFDWIAACIRDRTTYRFEDYESSLGKYK